MYEKRVGSMENIWLEGRTEELSAALSPPLRHQLGASGPPDLSIVNFASFNHNAYLLQANTIIMLFILARVVPFFSAVIQYSFFIVDWSAVLL